MKKIFILLITVVLMFSSLFTGCSSCNNDQKSQDQQYQEDGSVLVFGFESFEDIMNSVSVSAAESKVTITDDKEYVTQGGYAAKMQFNRKLNEKGYYDNSMFQLLCNTAALKKSDYSDVESVAIDVYNLTDYDIEFVFSKSKNAEICEYVVFRGVLKTGKNILKMNIDNEGLDFSDTDAFDFSFKGLDGDQSCLEICVDNFRVFLSKEKHTLYDKSKDYDGDNWYDFENSADAFCMMQFPIPESVFSRPNFSINRDKKYISSGSGSLKVDFYEKRDKTIDITGFRIMDRAMGDWNRYVGDANWYFTFDAFNATSDTISLRLQIINRDGSAEEYYIFPSFDILPNSWSDRKDTRIYVNDVMDYVSADKLDIFTVCFTFLNVKESGSIYIDNIRMAK